VNSNQKTTRTAGVLYLFLMITASLSLMYFQAAFTVPGDAAATANKIRASELLFRFGIVIDLVSGIIFILLNSLTSLLVPHYGPAVFTLMVLPETGQLWIALWLLIKGVKVEPTGEPVSIPGGRSGGSALQVLGQN
jgi:hypothetical protein